MNARIRKEVHTPYQVIEGTLVIRLGGRKRVLSFGLAWWRARVRITDS